MSSLVGPEMKFFRWILSHLTIIVVLSAIVYFYLNQYGPWSEEHIEATTQKPLIKSSEQLPDKKLSPDIMDEAVSSNNYPLEEKVIEKQITEQKSTKSRVIDSSHSSSDFSRRMDEYKQRLSIEEQKTMDNAAKTFQQESESVIQYPTDSDIKSLEQTDKAETEEVSSSMLTLKEKIISQLPDELPEESTDGIIEDKADALIEDKADALIEDKADALIEKQVDIPIIPRDKQIRVPVETNVDDISVATAANDEIEKPQHGSLAVKKIDVNVQDKKLQQQIRDRQKQLQEQMILLIPLDAKKTTSNVINKPKNNDSIKSIKPLIDTPEQKQLLANARQAFDLRNFKDAEKKYLQLIKQLPELPDVVGELANVYKTQNKVPDYLVTNTQFVKRLVNHKRFNEAWKVVTATNKIDKNTANKQRRIINNKQKQL